MPVDGRIVLLELDAADDHRLNKEAAMFRGGRGVSKTRAGTPEHQLPTTKG
jgi:hypothetical protein